MENIWKFAIIEALILFQGIVMLINPKWYQVLLIPLGVAIGYFIKLGLDTENG